MGAEVDVVAQEEVAKEKSEESFKQKLLALCEEYGIEEATIVVGEDASPWREVALPKERIGEMLRLSRDVIGALVGAKVRFTFTLEDGTGEVRFALGLKAGHPILFVRSSEGELRALFPGGMALFGNEILGWRTPTERRAAAVERFRALAGLEGKEKERKSPPSSKIHIAVASPRGRSGLRRARA